MTEEMGEPYEKPEPAEAAIERVRELCDRAHEAFGLEFTDEVVSLTVYDVRQALIR